MATINFKVKSYQNVDPVSNTEYLDTIIDIVPNDVFDPIQRPGSVERIDVGSGAPIDTIYWWNEPGWLIVFSGGNVYKVTSNYNVTQYTGTGVTQGAVSVTPYRSLNSTTNYLYFCLKSGSRIHYISSVSTVLNTVTDGDAPSFVTHVSFLHDYLLALIKGSQRITWADLGAPTSWPSPTEWIEAASQPDNVVAMVTGWDEVLLLGTRSIDFMYQTGDSDSQFEPIPGTAQEFGSISPKSLVRVDNGYYFLSNERKVMSIFGRKITVVSNDYDREIQQIEDVTDVIGYSVNNNGETYLIFSFPSVGKSYCYDYKRKAWGRWSYWNSTEASRENFLGNCSTYAYKWNKCFVGDRRNGKIYQVDKTYDTDAGDLVKSQLRTGWYDFGTDNKKVCTKAKFKMKRGSGITSGTTPGIDAGYMMVKWRNNGEVAWRGERKVSLGTSSQNEFYRELIHRGIFRSRQYELSVSDNTPTIVAGMSLDLKELRD